jgi:hypothetical protein
MTMFKYCILIHEISTIYVTILYTLFTVAGKKVFDVFGKDKQQLFVTDASCVLGKKMSSIKV